MEARTEKAGFYGSSAFPVGRSETSSPFSELPFLPVFPAKSVNLYATVEQHLKPINIQSTSAKGLQYGRGQIGRSAIGQIRTLEISSEPEAAGPLRPLFLATGELLKVGQLLDDRSLAASDNKAGQLWPVAALPYGKSNLFGGHHDGGS